jgi:hypothetical protein
VADQALQNISRYQEDDGIYHLKTVDQVIGQSKTMLMRARGIVLCDIFPGPMNLLADSLIETAARGVCVACRIYNEEQLPGVITQSLPNNDLALDTWPGQQINIVIDGEEHLLGLLAKDMKSVPVAVWSNSTFLSCQHHNNLTAEIILTNLLSGQPDIYDTIKGALKHISLLAFRPSGLGALIKRYGTDVPSPGKDGSI